MAAARWVPRGKGVGLRSLVDAAPSVRRGDMQGSPHSCRKRLAHQFRGTEVSRMNEITISGLGYELGERVHQYKEAPNFAAVMAKHRIPDMPALMGLGRYRVASDDILTLAIK